MAGSSLLVQNPFSRWNTEDYSSGRCCFYLEKAEFWCSCCHFPILLAFYRSHQYHRGLCKQETFLALLSTSSQAHQIPSHTPLSTAELLWGVRWGTLPSQLRWYTPGNKSVYNAEKAGVPPLKPFKMKGWALQQYLDRDMILSMSQDGLNIVTLFILKILSLHLKWRTCLKLKSWSYKKIA